MGTPAADDLWAKVAAAVRAQLSEATWNTWFQGVHALDCNEETLILGVPSYPIEHPDRYALQLLAGGGFHGAS